MRLELYGAWPVGSVQGDDSGLLAISTYSICKVLLMYVDILNGLIFDAVYGSWILSLPLFTLGTVLPITLNS